MKYTIHLIISIMCITGALWLVIDTGPTYMCIDNKVYEKYNGFLKEIGGKCIPISVD